MDDLENMMYERAWGIQHEWKKEYDDIDHSYSAHLQELLVATLQNLTIELSQIREALTEKEPF